MDLDVLTEAIDHLVEAGPSSTADGASMEALQRQLARLECFTTGATASFDASGGFEADGGEQDPRNTGERNRREQHQRPPPRE